MRFWWGQAPGIELESAILPVSARVRIVPIRKDHPLRTAFLHGADAYAGCATRLHIRNAFPTSDPFAIESSAIPSQTSCCVSCIAASAPNVAANTFLRKG
jgi:hypothetical protein